MKVKYAGPANLKKDALIYARMFRHIPVSGKRVMVDGLRTFVIERKSAEVFHVVAFIKKRFWLTPYSIGGDDAWLFGIVLTPNKETEADDYVSKYTYPFIAPVGAKATTVETASFIEDDETSQFDKVSPKRFAEGSRPGCSQWRTYDESIVVSWHFYPIDSPSLLDPECILDVVVNGEIDGGFATLVEEIKKQVPVWSIGNACKFLKTDGDRSYYVYRLITRAYSPSASQLLPTDPQYRPIQASYVEMRDGVISPVVVALTNPAWWINSFFRPDGLLLVSRYCNARPSIFKTLTITFNGSDQPVDIDEGAIDIDLDLMTMPAATKTRISGAISRQSDGQVNDYMNGSQGPDGVNGPNGPFTTISVQVGYKPTSQQTESLTESFFSGPVGLVNSSQIIAAGYNKQGVLEFMYLRSSSYHTPGRSRTWSISSSSYRVLSYGHYVGWDNAGDFIQYDTNYYADLPYRQDEEYSGSGASEYSYDYGTYSSVELWHSSHGKLFETVGADHDKYDRSSSYEGTGIDEWLTSRYVAYGLVSQYRDKQGSNFYHSEERSIRDASSTNPGRIIIRAVDFFRNVYLFEEYYDGLSTDIISKTEFNWAGKRSSATYRRYLSNYTPHKLTTHLWDNGSLITLNESDISAEPIVEVSDLYNFLDSSYEDDLVGEPKTAVPWPWPGAANSSGSKAWGGWGSNVNEAPTVTTTVYPALAATNGGDSVFQNYGLMAITKDASRLAVVVRCLYPSGATYTKIMSSRGGASFVDVDCGTTHLPGFTGEHLTAMKLSTDA